MWKPVFDFNISKCLLGTESYKKQISYLLWLIWYHSTHSWRVHSHLYITHSNFRLVNMFVLMVTEYLKRYHFSQVPFSSELVTNIMLLYSGDLNLTNFYFNNFSPSSDFIKGKTCIHCHVGSLGSSKFVRTPEGAQRAQRWVKCKGQHLRSFFKQGGRSSRGRTPKPGAPGCTCWASPLVPVLQLQRVHHVLSSMDLGVAVSPLQLQALWTRCSTFQPRRRGW